MVEHILSPVTANHNKSVDLLHNMDLSKEHSYGGFHQQIPFGASGTVPRNKIFIPGVVSLRFSVFVDHT